MELKFHLTFNDQCQAAFQFYAAQLAGSNLTMLSYAESPAAQQVP